MLALASDGKVYSLGDNLQGQLGRKVPPRAQLRALTPEQLALKRIRAIGTGAYHSFAMDLDGRVWAWGFNAAGQCGVAPERRERSWAEDIIERPTIVDALLPDNHGGARVIKIEAGSDHSLFLFDNGSVWACGKNIEHELGLADDHPALRPEEGSNERPKAVFQPVQVSICVCVIVASANLSRPGLLPSAPEPRGETTRCQAVRRYRRIPTGIQQDCRHFVWNQAQSRHHQ